MVKLKILSESKDYVTILGDSYAIKDGFLQIVNGSKDNPEEKVPLLMIAVSAIKTILVL